MKRRIIHSALIASLLCGSSVTATNIISGIDHNGWLTWTNITPTGKHHIEWSTTPTGPWNRHWTDLRDIVATGTAHTVALPMFFRVVHQPPVAPEWVVITNAGNANDSSGFGGVSYEYVISKYEISNDQYAEFLNNVDPGGLNLLSLYNPQSKNDGRGGIALNTNFPTGKRYMVKPKMGQRPVNFVSFWSAARFCNWLHHSKSNRLHDGAYNVGPNANPATSAISRNPGARYWIPSENEWFKAAYYRPGTNATYFAYPTGSSSKPALITTDSVTGEILTTPANIANYNLGASWGGRTGHLTLIGAAGSGSATPFGLFDMGGNVAEWTDSFSGTNRIVRGGSWLSWDYELEKGWRVAYPAGTSIDSLGFRIAGPAP